MSETKTITLCADMMQALEAKAVTLDCGKFTIDYYRTISYCPFCGRKLEEWENCDVVGSEE